MNIIEFKEKKYPNQFIDYKKIVREYNKNEKDKKRYFILKNKGQTNTFEFINLKNTIIWK